MFRILVVVPLVFSAACGTQYAGAISDFGTAAGTLKDSIKDLSDLQNKLDAIW